MVKIKVLMVDDEERFRTTTAKILARKGFETILAASGEEAMEKMAEKPDVVILDVKMGGLDGHETLKLMKDKNPDLPIIMLTGHGDVPGAKKAYETGAFDYLAKPCDVDLLGAKIQDAFEYANKRPYVEKVARGIMIPLEEYTQIPLASTVRDAIQALEKSMRHLLATDRLMDTGHRSVVVTNLDGSVAGLLSPLDLIDAVRPGYLSAPKPSMADSLQYSAMFWTGLFTTRVKEIMNSPVSDFMSDSLPVIDADANLMEVANNMVTLPARRMLVKSGREDIGIVREQELFYEIAKIISTGGNPKPNTRG
ncbi:response regulator [Pseudodesulfovibrio indicus]|jgi:FixJ family two-component response regulator|uniref:Histidine kinase n=1 Tax=Pseudodesulfovibrio indicus TaxID=1716143 RepID=A0A126QMQ9_9BACT|nr:response regulator [Pseudodesulfovibrio indicus]AMK10948.1 histidine kinase [Pseudodesulfovibrio indicus]TDT91944.1 response regulator receiver domain-containing protein [Pseudodesulfovibrio indicus]